MCDSTNKSYGQKHFRRMAVDNLVRDVFCGHLTTAMKNRCDFFVLKVETWRFRGDVSPFHKILLFLPVKVF